MELNLYSNNFSCFFLWLFVYFIIQCSSQNFSVFIRFSLFMLHFCCPYFKYPKLYVLYIIYHFFFNIVLFCVCLASYCVIIFIFQSISNSHLEKQHRNKKITQKTNNLLLNFIHLGWMLVLKEELFHFNSKQQHKELKKIKKVDSYWTNKILDHHHPCCVLYIHTHKYIFCCIVLPLF